MNEKEMLINRGSLTAKNGFKNEVSITKKGSFKIGNITVQRKGGDNGRESANMLQFKINPAELIP